MTAKKIIRSSQPQGAVEVNPGLSTLLVPDNGGAFREVAGESWAYNNTGALSSAIATFGRAVKNASNGHLSRTNPYTSGPLTLGFTHTPDGLAVNQGIWSIGASALFSSVHLLIQRNVADLRIYFANGYKLTISDVFAAGVPTSFVVAFSEVASGTSSCTCTVGVNGVVYEVTANLTSRVTTNEYLMSGYNAQTTGAFGEFWATPQNLAARVGEISGNQWAYIYRPRKGPTFTGLSSSFASTAEEKHNLQVGTTTRAKRPRSSQPQTPIELNRNHWAKPVFAFNGADGNGFPPAASARGLSSLVSDTGVAGSYTGPVVPLSSHRSTTIILLESPARPASNDAQIWVVAHGDVESRLKQSSSADYRYNTQHSSTLTGSITTVAGPRTPAVWALICDGANVVFKCNGQQVGSIAYSGSAAQSAQLLFANGTTQRKVLFATICDATLTDAQIAEIAANPWQLFGPRRSPIFAKAAPVPLVEEVVAPPATEHTLVGAASSQAASSGTGVVTQDHQLTGASTTQAASSGTGAVVHGATHDLAGAATSQAASSGTGAITQAHTLAGAATGQGATSGADSITQAHQLTGTTSSQATSSGTAAITATHVLAGAPASQAASSSAAAIVQVHALAVAAVAQAAASGTGAIGVTHVLAGAASSQAGASGTGTISQGAIHNLAGAPAAQAASSGTGAIVQTRILTGAGTGQSASSNTAVITQTHVLAGAASVQGASSGTGVVAQGAVHNLVGAASSQSAASGAAAIIQTRVLSGAGSSQGAVSAAAAITQTHQLAGAASSQQASSGVGSIAGSHTLSGAPSSSGATSSSGAITQGHVLQAAATSQAAASGTGGIVQTRVLQATPTTQGATSGTGSITSEHFLVGAATIQANLSSSGRLVDPATVLTNEEMREMYELIKTLSGKRLLTLPQFLALK